MKKQLIHGLNDSDINIDIIIELTKIEENYNATSEQALIWARRLEAQKEQSAMPGNTIQTKDLTKYLQETECKGKMRYNH